MTFDSPHIIYILLSHQGIYPGDPPAARIYAYLDSRGNKRWAVFMRKQDDDMHSSEFVAASVLLMEDGQLTDAGRLELAVLNQPASSLESTQEERDKG